TDRAWNFLLLMTILLATDRYVERGRGALGVLCAASLLFLNEIVFAAFAGSAALLFAILKARASLSSGIRVGCAIAVGFAVGALALAGANIFATGWEVFLADFRMTFLSRNYDPGGPAWREQVMNFYATHGIVFWPNFYSGARPLSL